MIEKLQQSKPPQGWKRLLFRAPLLLYRVGLGWLLGKRFLLLNHLGRKSGLARKTVLEVVNYDSETDTYYIASGYGKKAQWYKNIVADPNVNIQVGLRRLAVQAMPLEPDESGEMMVKYAKKYPKAAKALCHLVGYQVDGSPEDYRTIGKDVIPFFALSGA